MNQSSVNDTISDLYKRLEPLINSTELIDEKTRTSFKNLSKVIADAARPSSTQSTQPPRTNNRVKDITPSFSNQPSNYSSSNVVVHEYKPKKGIIESIFGLSFTDDDLVGIQVVMMVIMIMILLVMLFLMITEIPSYYWPIIGLVVKFIAEKYFESYHSTTPLSIKYEEARKELTHEISNIAKIKEKKEQQLRARKEDSKKYCVIEDLYDDRQDYDRYNDIYGKCDRNNYKQNDYEEQRNRLRYEGKRNNRNNMDDDYEEQRNSSRYEGKRNNRNDDYDEQRNRLRYDEKRNNGNIRYRKDDEEQRNHSQHKERLYLPYNSQKRREREDDREEKRYD